MAWITLRCNKIQCQSNVKVVKTTEFLKFLKEY